MFPYKDLQTAHERFIIVTSNWKTAWVFLNSRMHKQVVEYSYIGILINKYEGCIPVTSNSMTGSQKSLMKIIMNETAQNRIIYCMVSLI